MMLGKVTHIVFVLMAGTWVSKLLGFGREIIFAHRFGAGSISDAFLLTNSIPNILFEALASAISVNFIPLYMGLKNRDEQKYFASNLLNICIVASVFVGVVINLFPREILHIFAPGLPKTTLQYSVSMLHVISLLVAPLLLTSLFQAYSQANSLFFFYRLFRGGKKSCNYYFVYCCD